MKSKYMIVMLLLVVFVAGMMTGAVEYKRIANLRVTGWLFGASTWCGQKSWANAAAIDTLVVAGLDDGANCLIFLQADSIAMSISSTKIFSSKGRNTAEIGTLARTKFIAKRFFAMPLPSPKFASADSTAL